MLNFVVALILSYIALVSAAPRNVTIDDETGDALSGQLPTYIAHWVQGSTCGGCGSKPDPGQAFGGTWHDATIGNPDQTTVGLTLQFSGTALYVYFIVGWPRGKYTNTRLDIVLDGASVSPYIQPPEVQNIGDFQFNVPVYANSNLQAGSHTITFTAKPGTSSPVTMLFDYAVYTMDDGTTPSTPRPGTTTRDPSPGTNVAQPPVNNDSEPGSSSGSDTGSDTGSGSGSGPNPSTTGSNSRSGSGSGSNTQTSQTTANGTNISTSSSPDSTAGMGAAQSSDSSNPVVPGKGRPPSDGSTTSDSPGASPSDIPNPTTSENTSQPGLNKGLIAGAVVGGLIGLILIVLLCRFLRRRYQKKREAKARRDATPFVVAEGTSASSRHQSSTMSYRGEKGAVWHEDNAISPSASTAALNNPERELDSDNHRHIDFSQRTDDHDHQLRESALDYPHVNARVSVGGSTVLNLRREMVEVQAVLGHLRSELQSLTVLDTDTPPPGYVR